MVGELDVRGYGDAAVSGCRRECGQECSFHVDDQYGSHRLAEMVTERYTAIKIRAYTRWKSWSSREVPMHADDDGALPSSSADSGT